MENKKITFEQWVPIHGIPERLFLEGLHDDYEGFRIILQGENSKTPILRIYFVPLVFRNIDEGDYLRFWDNYGNMLKNWPLFIIRNSEFLEWFYKESMGVYPAGSVNHYFVKTPNDCVDILSNQPPIAEWLD